MAGKLTGVVIFFSKMVGRWNGGEVITGMRNGSICVWTGAKLTKIIANVHAGVCLSSVFAVGGISSALFVTISLIAEER